MGPSYTFWKSHSDPVSLDVQLCEAPVQGWADRSWDLSLEGRIERRNPELLPISGNPGMFGPESPGASFSLLVTWGGMGPYLVGLL